MSNSLVGGTRTAGGELRRHGEDSILGGVAAGLAHYLELEVALVRVALVALVIFVFPVLFIYLAMYIGLKRVVPELVRAT